MSHLPWIVVVAIAVVVGAWAGTKWPSINLIGKVTG